MNYPKNERWIKVLIGWVLSILFLAAVTAIFYALIHTKGYKL